ncbi:tyrosine-type recombinase/integrase [Streptomyces sp. NPDC058467]|uniref:tyrosine-type recombinase/integrase n=1 Tax=Streptomyces sp. NPDC058467 TaxID=3346513 RepID=UPI003658F95A
MGHYDRRRRRGPLRPARARQEHDAHRHHLRVPLPPGPDGGGHHQARRQPEVHPHGLRHFFASTALAHGIPIHEVSRWLGHRSIKTTVDVYGHLVPVSWDRCRTIMQTALRPDATAAAPTDGASGTPDNPDDPA